MNFMDIVRSKKAEKGEIVPIEIETEKETSTVTVLTKRDIPAGMPLTTDLTQMSVLQGAWAVCNGDAWLAYLKTNDGEVYRSPTGASAVEVSPSPAAVYKAICDTLENVWLALTDNMQTDLTTEQIPEWVDTLQWAVAVMPSGYERQRGVIEAELDKWQFFL